MASIEETLEYTKIKTNLAKVHSFASFFNQVSEEALVNNFLDKLSGFTRDLARLTDMVEELNAIMLSRFNQLTIAHKRDLIQELHAVVLLNTTLYLKLNTTGLREAVKTELKRYKLGFDDFKEICNDIHTSVDLDSDTTYNDLISPIINA